MDSVKDSLHSIFKVQIKISDNTFISNKVLFHIPAAVQGHYLYVKNCPLTITLFIKSEINYTHG